MEAVVTKVVVTAEAMRVCVVKAAEGKVDRAKVVVAAVTAVDIE